MAKFLEDISKYARERGMDFGYGKPERKAKRSFTLCRAGHQTTNCQTPNQCEAAGYCLGNNKPK